MNNILSEDVKKIVELIAGITIEIGKMPKWNLFQQSHRNLFPESKEFDMGVTILPQLLYAKRVVYTAQCMVEEKVDKTIPRWASSEIITVQQREEILNRFFDQFYMKIVNILSNQYAQAVGAELTKQEISGEKLNKEGEGYVHAVEDLIKILIGTSVHLSTLVPIKDFDIKSWPDFNITMLPKTMILQPWNITLTREQKEHYDKLSHQLITGAKKLTKKEIHEWYLLDIFKQKCVSSVKNSVETCTKYWETQSAQTAAQRELLWREKLPSIRRKYNYHVYDRYDGWKDEDIAYMECENRYARSRIEKERLCFLKKCELKELHPDWSEGKLDTEAQHIVSNIEFNEED